jgi:hypothetical protein
MKTHRCGLYGLFVLLIFATACTYRLPARPTAIPSATLMLASTSTPTSPPTQTPVPTATATLEPTATATATLPIPTATATPPPTATQIVERTAAGDLRIRFASGTTSAVVSGDLEAGESVRYVLRILGDQLLEVTLTPDSDLRLAVYGEDGSVLKRAASGGPFFRGYVPRNQHYFLEITAVNRARSYSANVVVPARIRFQRGMTSGSVDGRLAPFQSQHYILRVLEDQFLELDGSPQRAMRMSVYGVDGTVLKSGMGGDALFRGIIPSTQDYIVTLSAGDQAVTYDLTAIVPVRISFRLGAISGSVNDRVPAGSTQYYVLRALEGQNMQVDLTPPDDLQLSVYAADGTVLKSSSSSGASFSGELPSTQDYILAVTSGTQPVSYTLKVTIP